MTDQTLLARAEAETRAQSQPKLVVENVSKCFRSRQREVQALVSLSLEVADREVVCLVGASGCGKSTLLDIIAGLTPPDEGEVRADGIKVEGPGRQRLVMFQEPALFPWLTAFGNVMFGLKLDNSLGNAERHERAHRHLALVGLDNFAGAHVHELSGGMRQRVALARALAPDPKVLLMDEPFAALDAITRDQLYTEVQEIFSKTRKTVISVTHNVREAACLGDRILLISPRPGRIERSFTIDLPRPRDINDPALSKHAAEIAKALKASFVREPVA